jgi:Protein of unknown function (DUF1553)/Protein of unknown function (DUF1549)/Planctomycete cytochrome C
MFHRLAFLLTILVASRTVADEEPVRFNRDVRPILSNKCFQCHGPDEDEREGELRLDLRDAALEAGSEQKAIVPGDPAVSELIARVSSSDESLRMPPAEIGEPLSESEIDILTRWIAEGAEYQGHWAFLPLSKSEPPDVAAEPATPAPHNGIDSFIRRKLQHRKLVAAPEADRNTLIRRVYLDLIGLLPTPAEVEHFVNDDSSQAYDKLVTRLLASPHYGERWGRHWLDQARYADSNGYTIDGERVMWPYRDWVIRSLNDDMPFDQFTIEQLAGDLLPNPAKAQLIATGFHRNTLINQEGGTDPEQFRIEAVIDRVDTTGAVWLGLTIGCAQCHAHKFDPISQREFYEFFAFFNHSVDVNNVGPTVEMHEGELFLTDADPALLGELQSAIRVTNELEATRSDRQAQWEKTLLTNTAGQRTPDQLPWTRLKPKQVVAEEAVFTILEDDSVLATQGVLREIYGIDTAPLPADAVIGSLQLKVIPHESLPKNGPGLAGNGNFVLTEVEVFLDGEPLSLAAASGTHAQPGYPVSAIIDNDPGTGWAINIASGSSAKMNSEHTVWLALEHAVEADGKPLRIVMKHELNNNYNVGRFQFSWSTEVAEGTADAALLQAIHTTPKDRSKDQQRSVSTAFSAVDVDFKKARGRVDDLRRQLGLGPPAKTMVMKELAKQRPTWLLTRGDFLRPDKDAGILQPGVLACLPGLPSTDESTPLNRLDLAKWLVSPDNPLTPRVFVNRVWMRYFGHGLVETENDFGSQGSLPTHPDLLDWLAGEFVRNGWSQKELHRLIVTSQTYRQSSHARSDAAAVDPLNQMLARQNRLRLDAEIVRDVSLSAAGVLSERLGGASVHPPQPDGVYSFTQNRKNWRTDTDSNRYRRAMYTMFYRSAPYPALTTFDSPDFQSVCTRRERSNTPLQALTMANDAAIFELAQHVANRVLLATTTAANDRERIRFLFTVCFARSPQDLELVAVERFLNQQREGFGNTPEAAAAVAGDAETNTTELAAWTAVARAIMNTDEFITRE